MGFKYDDAQLILVKWANGSWYSQLVWTPWGQHYKCWVTHIYLSVSYGVCPQTAHNTSSVDIQSSQPAISIENLLSGEPNCLLGSHENGRKCYWDCLGLEPFWVVKGTNLWPRFSFLSLFGDYTCSAPASVSLGVTGKRGLPPSPGGQAGQAGAAALCLGRDGGSGLSGQAGPLHLVLKLPNRRWEISLQLETAFRKTPNTYFQILVNLTICSELL